MPSPGALIAKGGRAAATAAATAGGPPGILIGLGISIVTQIIGHLLKPRKKTPPQEILPWEEITAELGTTIPVVLGTTFVEKTMVLGKYNFHHVNVPAPKGAKK